MSKAVCVHAWGFTPSGDQEYRDANDGDVDGWCVYLRVPSKEPADSFEVPAEEDRDTYEEVMVIAEQWSKDHDAPIQVY